MNLLNPTTPNKLFHADVEYQKVPPSGWFVCRLRGWFLAGRRQGPACCTLRQRAWPRQPQQPA